MLKRFRPAFACLLTAFALAVFAPAAQAGSYWWTSSGTGGSNGWSWSQTGGYNPWGGGSRCESSAGTIPTGGYCQLQWSVPANLDAVSGSLSGQYRQNNANFEQHNFVEGNGNSILQGDATVRTYNRTWGDMASYLYVRLINTGAPQAVSAGTQWFDGSSFSINLVDPYNPGLNILEGHSGWKGTGGACIRYGFGEAGSGLDATALVRQADGATYDNPSYANGNAAPTTGVFQNDRNCVAVPAPGTGTWTYEARAADKSGNYVASAFNIAFDVTGPAVSAPTFGGQPVANGQEFRGSANQYRPTFTFTSSDAHSGLAANQIFLDGNLVANAASWTPGANLARGNHTVEVRSTDAVGNVTGIARTFTVIDDVAPTFAVAAPAASGDNSPILDITASDDYAGVAPATYNVTVDGAPLVATTSTTRLQANIGRLVNGNHTIVVTVQDAAGNTGTRTITYAADSGDGTPPVPDGFVTGIYVYSAPWGTVVEDTAVRIQALFVKNGRPVTGRAELRKEALTLAGKDISDNGAIDMQWTANQEGPILLHGPTASGLTAVAVPFTYQPHASGSGGYCTKNPSAAICQPGTPEYCAVAANASKPVCTSGDPAYCGIAANSTKPVCTSGDPAYCAIAANATKDACKAGGGGTGGTGGDGGNGGGTTVVYCSNTVKTNCTTPVLGTCTGPWSCNTVITCPGTTDLKCYNGLPLGESGSTQDKVAPKFKAIPVYVKRAQVLKKKQLRMNLWTSELSVVQTQTLRGKTRTTASARRKWRQVALVLDAKSPVLAQVKKAKAGSKIKVKVRIVARDKANNKTLSKWYVLTFKV